MDLSGCWALLDSRSYSANLRRVASSSALRLAISLPILNDLGELCLDEKRGDVSSGYLFSSLLILRPPRGIDEDSSGKRNPSRKIVFGGKGYGS